MAKAEIVDLSERLPTLDEITNAGEALTAIEHLRRPDGSLTIGDATLSSSLTDLVCTLFGIISRGETVTFVPRSRLLSTQEAADILNVSRPHLIKLINRGEIDCEMVGTHRRVPLDSLMSYKSDRTFSRRKALTEIQQLGEELATD